MPADGLIPPTGQDDDEGQDEATEGEQDGRGKEKVEYAREKEHDDPERDGEDGCIGDVYARPSLDGIPPSDFGECKQCHARDDECAVHIVPSPLPRLVRAGSSHVVTYKFTPKDELAGYTDPS